ncbi:hypothetical protein KUTeg_002178 [Tegillarca granosa]|uniref:Uncharacterized protein n=1 Tax=Tegillarca granosa TaxID=220873 RepID=A0ABQ9FWS4_TEGGR|nr:hypothetical protein KUTeg_002178 [Tegillarca granosa]
MDDAGIQQAIQNAVVSSQTLILDNMQKLLDSKLQNMEANLQKGQREISEAQLARHEENNGSVSVSAFKATRHEVSTSLDEQNINQAREKLSQGIDLVKHRQKLVKLADSSELGWKVEQNPLAEDSDDEKKINRATLAAERKQRSAFRMKKPYSRTMPVRESTDQSTSEKSIYRPGRCFTCGDRGHWAKESEEKCFWFPKQSQHWLGYVWGMFNITDERISRLITKLDSVLDGVKRECTTVSVRFLASIIVGWNGKVFLTPEAIDEIIFWRYNCVELNSKRSDLLSFDKMI